MNKAIEVSHRAQAPLQHMTPMDMLQLAVSNGATSDALTQLMGLQERWSAGEARKTYNIALSQAKAQIPIILKTNEKTGGGGTYKYEDLATIARIVDPILAPLHLNYRFRSSSDATSVTVTCVLTHRDGYSEESSLSAKPDTSGSKNPVQAVGSTVTYLQRYTLKLALGLIVAKDDDGGGGDAFSNHIQQKSAYQARKDGDWQALVSEIKAQPTEEKLVNWGTLNAARIMELPDNWRVHLHEAYGVRLTELREGVTEDGRPVVGKKLVPILKQAIAEHDLETGEIIEDYRTRQQVTGEIIDDEIPEMPDYLDRRKPA